MKLLQIEGITYVKKWFRLYYVAEIGGVLRLIRVRVAK